MSAARNLATRWQDLRRHPAFQTAAVYVGASWALIQVADIFFPSLTAVRWLGILLVAGFVVIVGAVWWLGSQESTEPAGVLPGAAAEAAASGSGGRRRRRRLAYTVAIGLVLLGGVFWWIRPNILGAVAPDAQVIAVLPFNTSGPGVELLGEGMVDLLSTNLDAVGGIRTIDSRTVLYRWRQRAAGRGLDLEGSLSVGRDVNAGAVLLGSVVSAGSEVRMTAELYSVKGLELAQARAEGPADSVLSLVDSLGIHLLRRIWLAREPVPNLRVSGITTGSVDAIRAYLRGQQFYRRSQWDSAIVAFQEAVREDPTFALAHYGLAQGYGWSTRHGGFGGELTRRHARLAAEHADRLPSRERSLVMAHKLFEDGRLAAHDSAMRYVERYPDDPEGWYLLGDVRYHALPLLALEYDEIFGPFDRVLELDPTLGPAMVHPLELSIAFDDSATYVRYLAAFEAVGEPSYVDVYNVGRLFWEDPDSFLLSLGTAPRARDRLGPFALAGSYRSARTPDFLLPGWQAAIEPANLSERQLIQFRGVIALVLAGMARLAESEQIFDTLWAIAPNEQESYFSLLPVIAGIADSAFGAQALQAMMNPPPVPGLDQLFQYSRALYELSRGRSAAARRLAQEALSADTSLFPSVMPHLLNAELGWADIIDGDTVGGVEKLRAGLNEAGYGSGPQMNFNQALRFTLATTLAARPETRAEGVRRLRHSYWFGDVLYIPLGYLALAQALEAAGDAAAAAEAYSQFIRLWENADPDLQPRVETARRALERLSAERVN